MAARHRTRRGFIPPGRGADRAIIRILLAAALTWCAGTMAAAGADLYRAKVTVTGQGEANRIIGFAACLEDVLIKVSGAQKLAGDRRLADPPQPLCARPENILDTEDGAGAPAARPPEPTP